jgi:hypothetical protein
VEATATVVTIYAVCYNTLPSKITRHDNNISALYAANLQLHDMKNYKIRFHCHTVGRMLMLKVNGFKIKVQVK